MWFFGKKSVDGDIGYYGLSDWWLSAFSENEQKYILKTYSPMGGDSTGLIKGKYESSSQSIVGFLSGLAGWFQKDEDRVIAHKVLDKAEEFITKETSILDLHFLYQKMIQINYKDREEPKYYDKAIQACREQISISEKAMNAFKEEWGENDTLPSHVGYTQLAIILYKEKKFYEVIGLCKGALKQGWKGDWENRMERCNKKLAKEKRTQ